MDKNILDIRNHLPSYYRGIREIDILADTLIYLLSLLSGDYQQILSNQFIQTADAEGMARFEKILELPIDPTEDLETRRQKVLSKMASSSVFTYKVLENYLREMCDNGEFTITSDLDTFFMDLKVRVGKRGMLDVIYDLLYTMLPAHIGFYIHNHLPAVSTGATTFALATRVKKSYDIVGIVNEKRSTTLVANPGLAARLSFHKDIVGTVEQALNSSLDLYVGGATSTLSKKDILDSRNTKVATKQIIEPVVAVTTAHVIIKEGD